MVENKKIINSDFIKKNFGVRSEIFKESITYFKEVHKLNEKVFHDEFKKWKQQYINIYRNNLNIDIFYRYLYYIIILHSIIENKIKKVKTRINAIDLKYILRYLIPQIDFLNEHEILGKIGNKIFKKLNGGSFASEDLFQEIYQEIFFMELRHEKGEFYTFPNLVKRMVESEYTFGMKTLDPSCGSGSFLVEIIMKILASSNNFDEKKEAISNIVGFDINPTAIITAKINIFLLLVDFFDDFQEILKYIKIYLVDALFPEESLVGVDDIFRSLKGHFDLIIGNPPWLTYKDIKDKEYQNKIRTLAEKLSIKPSSKNITHIELASIFFYAIPVYFSKINGKIFFVLTKSILNGDHCKKFRTFRFFKNVVIWDFPNNYFFNVNHVCLKASFKGVDFHEPIESKFPILTLLFDENMKLLGRKKYNGVQINENGVKIILPEDDIHFLKNMFESEYKKKFFQGATLIPKTLVFFQVEEVQDKYYKISSDKEIISRAKPQWKYKFSNKFIEKEFCFKTFLSLDLVPFGIKKFRNVFLPIDNDFKFNMEYLKNNTKAWEFYNEINRFYVENKKNRSKINSLFDNLNYWNKLTKQRNNKGFLIVYNASGSNLKAAVIENFDKNIIVSSENYYLSTDSQYEAFYLSGILNSPIFSEKMKLIKSSRHIHKRPFAFPIPIYEDGNKIHREIAIKSRTYHSFVKDFINNNPQITAEKIRILLQSRFEVLNELTKKLIFTGR